MSEKKKARAYIIDGHNGKRYGPERDASDKKQLEKDKKILEKHAMDDFTSSGIEKETDTHYQSERDIPVDSAYATDVKMEKEKIEKGIQLEKQRIEKLKQEKAAKERRKKEVEKAKAKARAKKKKAEKERKEKERWSREHEKVIREQGGSNARDHDVDRGRSGGVA